MEPRFLVRSDPATRFARISTMYKSLITKLSLGALLLAPLAVSCSTPPAALYTGAWLLPSPDLQPQIDANARRLPWTHGRERDELVRWFAKVGEPGYPVLLDLSQDPRPDVAEAALEALCTTGDVRLITALQGLPWPSEERVDLRFMRARALLRLGDQSMVPHLIGGLGHERLLIRYLCAQTLHEETGERFGYEPDESLAQRAHAIDRWNDWWTLYTTPPEEVVRGDVEA